MPIASEVTPAEGSFLSHANYLRAFALLSGFRLLGSSQRAVIERLSQSTQQIDSYVQAKRMKRVDLKTLKRVLANAWGTEILLSLSRRYAKDDELIRVTNTWGVVQLYYCIYHATQALALVRGLLRPESHPKTRKLFASFWVNQSKNLPPWTFGMNHLGYKNVPSAVKIDEALHPWTSCTLDSCWSIAAKAIRSTREDAMRTAAKKKRTDLHRARMKQWTELQEQRVAAGKKPLKEKKIPTPLLTAAQKRSIKKAVGTYSFMDYLWRLRIKANYEDATMFTEGPQHEGPSSVVLRDVSRLAAASLLVHELHIARFVGDATFSKLVDDWIDRNLPREAAFGVAARRHLLP
jgi:hypothetical protein